MLIVAQPDVRHLRRYEGALRLVQMAAQMKASSRSQRCSLGDGAVLRGEGLGLIVRGRGRQLKAAPCGHFFTLQPKDAAIAFRRANQGGWSARFIKWREYKMKCLML